MMKRDVQPQKPPPAGAGKVFWFLLCAAAFLRAALLVVLARRSGSGVAAVAPAVTDQVVATKPVASVETNPPPTTADRAESAPTAPPVPPLRISAPELPAPSAESRQLVNDV